MTFTAIPNGVRVVHLGHIGTSKIVNTIGAQNLGGPIDSGLADIAKRHGDAWRSKIVVTLSSQYVHDATLCYSLEDQSKAAGDAGYSSTQAGGITADPVLPAQVAMVVSFKTAKRGRTYQGRTFVSGIGQFNLDPSGIVWKAAQLPVHQTAWNAYKAAVDPQLTGNGAMAVCSKGSAAHQIAPHVTPVTAVLCRPYLGTQRRRVN